VLLSSKVSTFSGDFPHLLSNGVRHQGVRFPRNRVTATDDQAIWQSFRWKCESDGSTVRTQTDGDIPHKDLTIDEERREVNQCIAGISGGKQTNFTD
jgi:hypothetical protein